MTTMTLIPTDVPKDRWIIGNTKAYPMSEITRIDIEIDNGTYWAMGMLSDFSFFVVLVMWSWDNPKELFFDKLNKILNGE